MSTHALPASSIAVDANGAPCSQDADPRGVSRPQGAGCDAGAFELECTTPSSLPGCPALPLTPTPPATTPPPAGACDALTGKARKRCLCREKKGKARKKCLKKLKGRKD